MQAIIKMLLCISALSMVLKLQAFIMLLYVICANLVINLTFDKNNTKCERIEPKINILYPAMHSFLKCSIFIGH